MTLRANAKQAHICSAILTEHESVMKRLAALGKLLIAEAFGSPRHLIEMAFVNVIDIVNDKAMFDDALSLPLSLTMTMSMESPNSTPNAS